MSDVAISVENLGKKFRIGTHQPYHRFSELLTGLARNAITAPARWFAPRAKGEQPASDPTEFWALRDLSFEVKQGEVVGIIGRNGAGKSTLLKLLSRITEPTTGRIGIRGRVASLLEVGTGFHPELTGRENIYLNGAVLGMTRREIQTKFDEIVDFAEIEQFLDTPVKHYSSGMYMRLGFAVAAHLEPEILIVDEVLAVGDAQFQKKCLGKMGDVARGGRTVLFVSHSMNAIQQLCTHAILLQNGTAVQQTIDVHSVIKLYFKSSDANADVAEWTAKEEPKENKRLFVRRLWLGDESGKLLLLPLDRTEVAYVYIQTDIHHYHNAMTIGYSLLFENGETIYWSQSTDGPQQDWPVLPKGTVTIRSPLPVQILNEGLFRIELVSAIYAEEWINAPGGVTPTISFTIRGKSNKSPLWTERRPGVISPNILWQNV